MKKGLPLIKIFVTLILTIMVASSTYSQNALHFDGVDDYVETTFPGITGGSTPITVEAWIKNYSGENVQVITDWGANSTGGRFTFRLQDVGSVADVIRIEVSGSGMNGNINVGDSAWHHVAVVFDPSDISNKYKLYVDGVLDVQGNLSTTLNVQSGSNLRIGQRMASMTPHNFDGIIEEVRVWNVARSLTQLVADSATEFCQPQTGLVAYHRFNSGTAGGTNTSNTVSFDDSGLNNNGQLYGFALAGNSSNWVNGKLTACVPPTCLSPTALGAYNVFGSTAEIYWSQSNTGSTVKVEYGTTGFTLGQGTKLTPSNDTISLTGLSPQTTYDVYVKEICSATDSSLSSVYTFTTGCGVISTFPYLESFDSTTVWVGGTGSYNTGASLDPCWVRNPSFGTNIYSWGPRSTSPLSSNTGPSADYSGSGNFMYTEASYGASGAKANLVSPHYDLSSLTIPQLTFQNHMYGINIGALSLWVWNGSSYDTVWSQSGDQGNRWNEVVIDLSAYANTTTHLVFHAERGVGYSGDLAIDHVQIEETPPCPKPTQVYLDSITSNSVNVNFVSPGTKFTVEYGPTGFNQASNTTLTTILSSGSTITGLSPNTVYDFYIQNDCTDSSKGTSAWAGPYTIHTTCAYSNAYFTDWDQLSNNETDFCWSFVTSGSSAFARAYAPSATANPQPFSAPNYYRIYNYNSVDNFLISPEIADLPLNNLQLRFQGTDAYSGSVGTPEFYVGTLATINDTASFTAIDTLETITNIWTEFTVLLNNVPANHKHVVIRHGNNTNYVYMGIDDLYIEAVPACIPPRLGVFSQIQDTSAVLDWIPGDASVFDIEYGPTGFIQGAGTLVTNYNDTNFVATGLAPQTCYDFYIKGNCSSSNSPWYGPVTFCTECATVVAPYLETFDDSTWVPASFTANEINECWTRNPDPMLTFRWETGTGSTTTITTGPDADASGSGNYVFTESNFGSSGNAAIIETPVINFSNLTNPALSFAYHMHGGNMGNLYVLISNGSQFDTIHEIKGEQQSSSSDAWKTAYVDLSAYTGPSRIIRFLGERGASATSDMAIDEVSVDEMPTCVTPDSFVLDSLNALFADFSWNSVTNGSSFKLQYGPVGFNQASNTGYKAYASSSPTRLSGLSANTTYDIYLADMCDSNSWVGPITFTTLINDDAQLQNLISPSNLVCGDSNYVVEIMVKNNGLNPITTMGVGADITGAIATSLTNVFSGNIAPGASATITVGTINTYAGGIINIEAYSGLLGDQVTTNDTLMFNSIEIISAQPQLHPIDSVCANDTIGQFAAITQTGITYNWYQNATDVAPFATGDTVDVQPNQTLFVDRSKDVDQLVVDAPYTSSQFGNMFKVYVKNDFTFTGFSFVPATSGTAEPIAFYKQGNFVGHETNRGAWTATDSLVINSAQANNWYRINFTNPVQFTAGDTISFYLANKQGTKIRWEHLTQLNAVGDLLFNNADFEYYAGVTGAYFGNNMTSGGPRAVSSIIHYSSTGVCSNGRLSFTMGVRSDSAMASFTHTISNGVDVDFDASASTGHVYNWNFGDGNNGNGENTNHTYSNSGAYKVTLTVTDTVCGTTDTISQTVNVTIGLSEYALDGRVAVYPNPNNGNFKVDLNLNGADDVQLVLVNTIGQMMYNQYLGQVGTNTTTELNIENLTPGIYHLHVMASGKSTTVKITIL